ncbi:transmembrane protein 231-like isoform X1 [Varroa jacobsoni]|uniref:Transmembrane protein 231 n=1 Tax=Varroa destructor TaxID=109461 RepID=A0A7M7ME82_VARDE|nr:transmembrane protein 231-like isoform X2 [Varroa destructor]XP_022693325.1 transmembrane protein 231-like isoform X1 [Varroa jacobsoni]
MKVLQGLWRRVDVFSEQPKIDFKKDFILLLDTRDGDVIAASRPQQGRLSSNLPIMRLAHSPTDTNLDLRPERHDIRFVVDAGNITGIRLLLKLEARLQTMAGVLSNCLAYIEYSSSLVGSSLSVTGDLRVTSSFVIPFKSYSDLRTSSDFTEPLEHILEEHSKSKVKCTLEGTTKVWRPKTKSAAAPDRFTLSLTLNTAEQSFTYRPGLSHILKLGWMQYFSVMVIFAGLAVKLKKCVFENQIIATYCSPGHPYCKMQK